MTNNICINCGHPKNYHASSMACTWISQLTAGMEFCHCPEFCQEYWQDRFNKEFDNLWKEAVCDKDTGKINLKYEIFHKYMLAFFEKEIEDMEKENDKLSNFRTQRNDNWEPNDTYGPENWIPRFEKSFANAGKDYDGSLQPIIAWFTNELDNQRKLWKFIRDGEDKLAADPTKWRFTLQEINQEKAKGRKEALEEVKMLLDGWTMFSCHSQAEHEQPDNDCPGWSHEWANVRELLLGQIKNQLLLLK